MEFSDQENDLMTIIDDITYLYALEDQKSLPLPSHEASYISQHIMRHL